MDGINRIYKSQDESVSAAMPYVGVVSEPGAVATGSGSILESTAKPHRKGITAIRSAMNPGDFVIRSLPLAVLTQSRLRLGRRHSRKIRKEASAGKPEAYRHVRRPSRVKVDI